MPTPISSLAIFAPMFASNAIFSFRRASRGVESMDENPLFGAMNMTIAGSQLYKGVDAGLHSMLAMDPAFNEFFEKISRKAVELSDNHKFIKHGGKFMKFIGKNINPVICLAGGVKVLGSEDKLDAAARESTALGTMFLAEGAYKYIVGMPKMVDGEYTNVNGIYKKYLPFIDKQLDALKDTKFVKNSLKKLPALKSLPGVLKGVGFAIASILGYKTGTKIASRVIDGESAKATT